MTETIFAIIIAGLIFWFIFKPDSKEKAFLKQKCAQTKQLTHDIEYLEYCSGWQEMHCKRCNKRILISKN
jgi:hypothetical protein